MFRLALLTAAAVVCVAWPGLAQQGPAAGCECLETLPETFTSDGDLYDAENECIYYEEGGQRFCYPISYGLGSCQAHDQFLAPYCDGPDGANPDFCRQPWCWVDVDACDQALRRSSYFPQSGLYYSYATCGGKNTFLDTVGQGSFTDLIRVVENYVLSVKSALQEASEIVDDLVAGGDTASCKLDNACDSRSCLECTFNECWGLERDWSRSNTVLGPALEDAASADEKAREACMSELVAATQRKIADVEYNDRDRVAYQYYGSQATGAMTLWPATKLCSDDFDPRQRPWYAAAASGPKDLVLVIDVSGSMSGERIRLARDAAKAVLNTVTEVDYVSIVTFNDDVKSVYSETLVPATDANLIKLKEWVDSELVPGGSTNFNAPLARAYQILERGSAGGHTSCSKAVLFMSDGEAVDPLNINSIVQDQPDVVIFSYALSQDANADDLAAMACATNGLFYPVPNAKDLPDAMAGYYKYFVMLQDQCRISWRRFNDFSTGAESVTACSAIFDPKEPTPMLQGVGCVELNVLVAPERLKTCGNNGYDKFLATILKDAARCTTTHDVDPCALAKLRAEISPASICAASSVDASTCEPVVIPSRNCSAPDLTRFDEVLLEDCSSDALECEPPGNDGGGPGGDDDDDDDDGPGLGVIIGGAVGGVVVLGTVAFFALCYKKQKRKEASNADAPSPAPRTSSQPQAPESFMGHPQATAPPPAPALAAASQQDSAVPVAIELKVA